MTKQEIHEIKVQRELLDIRGRALARSQAILRAEYAHLQTVCEHPGLKLNRDQSGGRDGTCSICGKVW